MKPAKDNLLKATDEEKSKGFHIDVQKFEPKIELVEEEDEDVGGIRDKAKAVSAYIYKFLVFSMIRWLTSLIWKMLPLTLNLGRGKSWRFSPCSKVSLTTLKSWSMSVEIETLKELLSMVKENLVLKCWISSRVRAMPTRLQAQCTVRKSSQTNLSVSIKNWLSFGKRKTRLLQLESRFNVRSFWMMSPPQCSILRNLFC